MIVRLRKNDVLMHGAIAFGGVVVSNVFNYLYYMLVGRRAGVVTYGEVTSVVSVLFVLAAPATVGQLVVARLSAGLDAVGDRASLRRLGDLVTMWTGAVGLLAIVVLIAARDPIAHFFAFDDAGPVVAGAVSLAMLLVAFVQRGVLQGAHLFTSLSASLAIEAVVKVIVGVALVGRFGATGAIAGVAIGLACAAAYNLAAYRLRFGTGRARIPHDRATVLRVVGGIGLGQLTITVLTFYDVPLVKHAFDPRSAGLYAAAALVGRAVIGACSFLPIVLLPKATARAATGASALPMLFAGAGSALAITAVAAAAAAIAPAFVVTVIAGRAFAAAAPYVLPYVVAAGLLSTATVAAAYNFALHRYAFVPVTAIVACAEIVTLCAWHPTISAVVAVLATGHACVLAATLSRVHGRARVVAPADAELDAQPIPVTETI